MADAFPFSAQLPYFSAHRNPRFIAVRFTHTNEGKQVCCEIGAARGPGGDIRSIEPLVACFHETAEDALKEATKAFHALMHARGQY